MILRPGARFFESEVIGKDIPRVKLMQSKTKMSVE
jgi:hypothetical protein